MHRILELEQHTCIFLSRLLSMLHNFGTNVASCQYLYDNTSKTGFNTEYHHQWSSTRKLQHNEIPGARALILPYLYFKLKQMRIWFYRVLSSSWKSVSSSSLWNGSRSPFLCILLLMTAQPNAKPSRVPSTKQPTEMPAIVPAMSKEWCSISPVLKRLCRIQFHSAASSVLFVDKSSAVQITIPEKVPSMSPYTWKYIFYIILLLIRAKILSLFEWYIIYISNKYFCNTGGSLLKNNLQKFILPVLQTYLFPNYKLHWVVFLTLPSFLLNKGTPNAIKYYMIEIISICT